MFGAFYLDWVQEQDRNDCYSSAASSFMLIQQNPLSAIRNITSAKLPNNHKVSLSVKVELFHAGDV